MNKLLALKEWITLEDAATLLNSEMGCDVQLSDLYQLALSEKIRLSLYLVNMAVAQSRSLIPIEQAQVMMFGDLVHGTMLQNDDIPPNLQKVIRILLVGKSPSVVEFEELKRFEAEHFSGQTNTAISFRGELIPDSSGVLETSNISPQTIVGIWDLAMVGSEVLDIEDLLMAAHGGPEISKVSLSGVYLCNAERTQWMQLMDDDDLPAAGLPDDALLVIRTSEVKRLIEQASAPTPHKQSQRSESSLLNIIGGLLDTLTNQPPRNRNQEAVKIALLEKFAGAPGISKSNLESKFAAANRAIKANTDDPS